MNDGSKTIVSFVRKHAAFLAVMCVTTILLLVRLGRDPLFDWDECIYATYALQNDWKNHPFINLFNGNLMFDKSAAYTTIIWVMSLIREGEFILRLPSVVGLLGIMVLVYGVVLRTTKRMALAVITPLFLISSNIFAIYSTKVSTDIIYTFFLLAGVLMWIEKKNTKHAIFSGILLAMAVLIKGPSIAPYVVALTVVAIITQEKNVFKNIAFMLLALVGVALPWHLYAYLAHPERFVQMYIIDNLYKRAKFPIENHMESRYFYLRLLAKEWMQWIWLTPVIPVAYLSQSRAVVRRLKPFLKQQRLVLYILCIIAFALSSLTLAKTRLIWYAAPLYPFIALYLALCAHKLMDYLHKSPTAAIARYGTLVIYGVISLIIIYQAHVFFVKDIRLLESTTSISPRDEMFHIIRKQPQQIFTFLVPYGERQGKRLLPKDQTITLTWIWGGAPCAPYYSRKKINYLYEEKEFVDKLSQSKANNLYLVENGDWHFVEKTTSRTKQEVKILKRNTSYTLFTH